MISVAVMGPVCAGKTTFIRSLSDGDPVSTDEPATTPIGKAKTTVGVDVGFTHVEGHKTKLTGFPGQERFEYVWDILASGADGFVLLIPADHKNVIAKTKTITAYVPSRLPVGIGITRIDRTDASVLSMVNREFSSRAVFVERMDARNPDACRRFLASLIRSVDPEGSE
jgi:signal recognition particle receptor subunit beta